MASPLPSPHCSSPWPHRWAWALASATFPLIWWGGFVTSTDAGMAFRDWLTSDGHFVLVYPWLSSSGDKFIEHGHRLLAIFVGLLTIALVVATHRSRAPRSIRWFSWALLIGVIAQGVLGGLRVVLDARTMALIHGCTGPLFFIACVAMVVVTSRSWHQQSRPSGVSAAQLTKLARVTVAAAALAYLQILLGAVVRHAPHLTSPTAASLFQAAVYLHVFVAFVLTAYLLTLAVRAWRAGTCVVLGGLLAALVVCQVLLGSATWFVKYGVPRWIADLGAETSWVNVEASVSQAAIATSHVAVGSLIAALAAAAAMTAWRRAGWSFVLVASAATSTGRALA